jgi:hypothetical protein
MILAVVRAVNANGTPVIVQGFDLVTSRQIN